MKKVLFYLSLLTFIVLINSGGLKFILDNLFGFPWSAPIVIFLEKNSQGFLVIFFIALFWDSVYRRISSKNDEFSNELTRMNNILEQNGLGNADAGLILEKNIHKHYGIETNVSNLLDIVFSKNGIHTNVNISYKLSDKNCTDDKYTLRYQYEFNSKEREFYIAFLTSADLQDQLSASSTIFFDMFVFSDVKCLDENIKRMEIDGFYIKSIGKKNGMTVEDIAHFKKIPKNQYSKLLPSWFSKSTGDIVIYKATCEHKAGVSIRHVYSQVYTMDISDNYCYWVSDRTLFLEKIEIDLENFLDTKGSFVFQPFLANSIRANTIAKGQGICKLNVNNWVVKGQGVLIIWRKNEN